MNSSSASTLNEYIYITNLLCEFWLLYTCHQAVSVEQNCVLHFVIFIIDWNRTLRIHSRSHTSRKPPCSDSASNLQYRPDDVSSSPPQISAATIKWKINVCILVTQAERGNYLLLVQRYQLSRILFHNTCCCFHNMSAPSCAVSSNTAEVPRKQRQNGKKETKIRNTAYFFKWWAVWQ